MTSVWLGKRYEVGEKPPVREENFFGAPHIKTKQINMAPSQPAENCVTVGEGTWRNKIIHFLPDMAPGCGGEETATEYMVPFEKFPDALNDLWAIRDKFNHLLQNGEYRIIEADDIPMSVNKGRRSFGLHFHWKPKPEEVK